MKSVDRRYTTYVSGDDVKWRDSIECAVVCWPERDEDS